MKAFLWLVLLGFLGVCFYFIFMTMVPDESRSISFALGNTNEDTMEIHVELTMSMVGTDTLAYSDMEGNIDWPTWAGAHFVLTDNAGTHVEFAKRMQSNLISDLDTRGLNDSFIVGTVKPGVAYTFTYIPIVGEPEQFLYEFTATMEDAGRRRVCFEPI